MKLFQVKLVEFKLTCSAVLQIALHCDENFTGLYIIHCGSWMLNWHKKAIDCKLRFLSARHLIAHRDVSEAVRGFLYSCQLSLRTVFFNNTVATHHLSKSHTLSEVNWILKTNIKFHRYNRSLKIFLSSELAANCVSLNGSGRMKLPWVCIIILQTIDRKCMTGWEKICDFFG